MRYQKTSNEALHFASSNLIVFMEKISYIWNMTINQFRSAEKELTSYLKTFAPKGRWVINNVYAQGYGGR